MASVCFPLDSVNILCILHLIAHRTSYLSPHFTRETYNLPFQRSVQWWLWGCHQQTTWSPANGTIESYGGEDSSATLKYRILQILILQPESTPDF